MSARATRQRLLRQVLVAVLDAPAPRKISFDDERSQLNFDCDSAAAGRALAKALHLRDADESGQPHPLDIPDCWSGWINGWLLGWHVQISFNAAFTGEFVERWDRYGGFKRHGTVRPAAELAVTP